MHKTFYFSSISQPTASKNVWKLRFVVECRLTNSRKLKQYLSISKRYFHDKSNAVFENLILIFWLEVIRVCDVNHYFLKGSGHWGLNCYVYLNLYPEKKHKEIKIFCCEIRIPWALLSWHRKLIKYWIITKEKKHLTPLQGVQ